jgi:hypothetical protein
MTHIENLKNYIRITSAKKNAIRKHRTNGLKKYDKCLSIVDEKTIINRAISLYKQTHYTKFNSLTKYYFDTYGWNDWVFFHYDCFLKVVYDILESIDKKYSETSISFNLDEVLSPEQINYVSKTLGISTDAYDDTFPRDLVKIVTNGLLNYGRASGFPNARTNG